MGHLVSSELLALGAWAVPVTVFCVVGSINAFNLIDGLDGLAGTVSFVTLLLLGVVTYVADRPDYFTLIVALLGGVAGFLLFNLRWVGRDRAHVFLGDAGSTVLGFTVAWLLIALSQGPDRVITPVTALWLFGVPLIDTVAVMLRRVWLRRSPFHPDRQHIHHLLQDAGFRVRHAVNAIALTQAALGAIGLAGMYAGLPQRAMFIAFLLLFLGYFFQLSRPWRTVPVLRRLHRALGLTVRGAREVYVGGLDPAGGARAQIEALLQGQGRTVRYHLYRRVDPRDGHAAVFAVVEAGSADGVGPLVTALRRQLPAGSPVTVRQFFPRRAENDPRKAQHGTGHDRRRADRRAADVRLEATHVAAPAAPEPRAAQSAQPASAAARPE